MISNAARIIAEIIDDIREIIPYYEQSVGLVRIGNKKRIIWLIGEIVAFLRWGIFHRDERGTYFRKLD